MEIVLLLVGLLFAGLGVLIVRSAQLTAESGQRFDGQVIGYSRSRSGSGTTFAPVIAFHHPEAGRSIFSHPVASGGISLPIGRRVRVLASPTPPIRARIDSNGIFVFGGTFALIGCALVALFFTIFRWGAGSIFIAVAVGGAVLQQAWRRRSEFVKPVGLARTLADTSTSEVVPESDFDTAALVGRADLDAMMRRQPQQALIGGTILLILAIGGLAWSWFWVEKRSAFLDRAATADGEVVELARSSGSKGTTWAPVVEFQPAGTWKAVRFRHSVASSHPSWKVGDPVRVLYDPQKPEDAMIDSGFWNRGGPYVPGVVGALLGILAFWILRSGQRQREQVALPA